MWLYFACPHFVHCVDLSCLSTAFGKLIYPIICIVHTVNVCTVIVYQANSPLNTMVFPTSRSWGDTPKTPRYRNQQFSTQPSEHGGDDPKPAKAAREVREAPVAAGDAGEVTIEAPRAAPHTIAIMLIIKK